MRSVARALVLFAFAGIASAEESRPLWLAVGRPGLVEALAPLEAHRRAEGFDVVVSTEPVAAALAAAGRAPAFLLLVGDDDPAAADAPWSLPAPRRRLYRWRPPQRETFAADALLGDLDGDLRPDVPVGRLPARSRAEVEAAVARILAHEMRPPSEADLRLILWGGSPGYGPRLDAMATGMLLGTMRRHAPPWLSAFMISAAPGQPLCGWPPDHPALFLEAHRGGGLLSVVMAHANEDLVLSVRHEGANVVLTADHARPVLAKGPPTSPLLLLSCSSGRFDRSRPGLAEALFAMPGGPVAVVGATTESHPLTNYFTGVELLRAIRPEKRRLGDLWLEVQTKAADARDGIMEAMLRDVEGKLEPDIDVTKLRRDQLLMYALLGDPATTLKAPEPLDVTVERVDDGWRWTIDPVEGATAVSVGLRSLRWPSTVPAKGPLLAEAARESFREASARLVFETVSPAGEGVATSGRIDRKGWLRVIVTGPGVFRVGVVRVR